MKNFEAYNEWSKAYDSMENQTRDLEAGLFRSMLKDVHFSTALELGCGTGKNTAWLSERCVQLTAVDFSVKMMEKAKQLVSNYPVEFVVADITKPWSFVTQQQDLVCTSLVLEHVADLSFIFSQAARVLNDAGYFYIGELHPYKQYNGTKARFQFEDSTFVLDCFIHHISDFINAALEHGFLITALEEGFDKDDRSGMPRILSMIFKKAKYAF